TAMFKPGDWHAEREELVELLLELPLPEGMPSTPDETMFYHWAECWRAIEAGVDKASFAFADEAGSAFLQEVRTAPDPEFRMRWRTEHAICQLQLVRRRRYFDAGTSRDADVLGRLALALQNELSDPGVSRSVRFGAFALAAELWFEAACIDQTAVSKSRAADVAQAAAEFAARDSDLPAGT